jgi:hypothetical protein
MLLQSRALYLFECATKAGRLSNGLGPNDADKDDRGTIDYGPEPYSRWSTVGQRLTVQSCMHLSSPLVSRSAILIKLLRKVSGKCSRARFWTDRTDIESVRQSELIAM